MATGDGETTLEGSKEKIKRPSRRKSVSKVQAVPPPSPEPSGTVAPVDANKQSPTVPSKPPRRLRAATSMAWVSPLIQSSRRFNRQSEDEKETSTISEELAVQPNVVPLAWEKHFDRERDRFSFEWWGDRKGAPQEFTTGDISVRQVALGGRHFVLLSSK